MTGHCLLKAGPSNGRSLTFCTPILFLPELRDYDASVPVHLTTFVGIHSTQQRGITMLS